MATSTALSPSTPSTLGWRSAAPSAASSPRSTNIAAQNGSVKMIRQPMNSNGGTQWTSRRYSGSKPQIRYAPSASNKALVAGGD